MVESVNRRRVDIVALQEVRYNSKETQIFYEGLRYKMYRKGDYVRQEGVDGCCIDDKKGLCW